MPLDWVSTYRGEEMRPALPEHGRPWAEIKDEMSGFSTNDVKWREGRHAFHVWYGGDDIFEVQRESYAMYMQENGGGAGKTFKSLKIMEDAVIDYAAGLLQGKTAVGHITSGGSESIFVALKAARDWARKHKPEITSPEVVIPFSGHPTFNRAAEYLGLTIVRVPVATDLRGDVPAVEAAINANTIALVGSAVCFPYGVVDPISDLSALAQRKNLWLHVDACIAGLQAPFARELGYEVPDFDFSLPGVSSIS
ncbi:MAG: aminotransferase class V-fold PLP-dependent enzyme, partial [Actinobacteria bacterium]|nr:aminotransferase class V-fold PLP-dependent enzyme [Actinomycetota bacterium]